MQRKMTAPGVTDRPRAVDREAVENTNGIGDVGLDRIRRISFRRIGAALLVAHRPENTVELTRTAVHVVGDGSSAVEEQPRRSLAADVTLEHATGECDLERRLRHGRARRAPRHSGAMTPRRRSPVLAPAASRRR